MPFGSAGWSAMIDGDSVHEIHSGPFAMQGTGSGTAMVNASFGTPVPGMFAPAIEDGFGIRHCFRLSPGDTAIYASSVFVAGDADDFRSRPITVDPIRIAHPDPGIRIEFDRAKPGRPRPGVYRGGMSPSSPWLIRPLKPRRALSASETAGRLR